MYNSLIEMRTSFLKRLSDDEQEQIESNSTDQPKNILISRPHQYWPGTHRFFFKGKLITGPFRDTFIYSVFVLALFIHGLLFLTVLLPEVSTDLHFYFLFLYGAFFVGSLVFYFLTAFTEPGLLPTKKFLKVRATLNKEDHQIEKLNLLTQYLQGFYSSVLNLYWSRKLETASRETFSELAARPVKLGDLNEGISPIPEKVLEESEGNPEKRSVYSNHRDNAEYHDDILTYKSESARDQEADNVLESKQENEEDVKSEKEEVVCKSEHGSHSHEHLIKETVEGGSTLVALNASSKEACLARGLCGEKNWLLEDYKSRFCLHCEIYKTKDAVHCDHCNSCVRCHNHHCVFVNNCIGKRNYKHFLALVSCLLLLNIYFIVAMFLAFPQLMLIDLSIFRSFIMLLFLQSVLISGYCMFHLFLFFSYLISGEDPSRVREHSPLRSFLFKRLRKLKAKINRSFRRKQYQGI